MEELFENKTVIHMADLCPNKMGSFEEYLSRLSNNLVLHNNKVIVVFECKMPEKIKRHFNGVNVCSLSLYRGKIKYFIGFVFLLLKYRPDLLHVSFYPMFSMLPLIAKLLGVKYVVHSDRISGDLYIHSGVKKWIVKARNKFMCRFIDKIICISDYVYKRDLKLLGMNIEKLVRIHNGVDTKKYFRSKNNSSFRYKNNVSGNDLLVTIVASMTREKGVHILIDAIKLLRNKCPDIKCWAIGEGRDITTFKEMVSERGLDDIFIFWGRRSDVQDILSVSDIFVYPSIWSEAFGFSIAEAMSSGLPVISTCVGGIPEIIDEDTTGIIVPPDNVEMLSRAIFALYNDKGVRLKMGKAGRLRVENKFNLNNMVDEYIKVYSSL